MSFSLNKVLGSKESPNLISGAQNRQVGDLFIEAQKPFFWGGNRAANTVTQSLTQTDSDSVTDSDDIGPTTLRRMIMMCNIAQSRTSL